MPLQTPAKSWPEGYTGQIRAIASGEKILENQQGRAGRKQKEKDDLRQGLTEMLKEIEYTELSKKDQEKVSAAEETLRRSPLPIFVG